MSAAIRRVVTGMTVDAPGARDLDDAIWVERTRSGGYVLTASAADVAWLVPPGSADDRMAEERGLSVYAAGSRIPMLGDHLVSRIGSLSTGRTCMTITVEVNFDAEGNRVSTEIFRSKLRSVAALPYAAFADILFGRRSRLTTVCEDAVDLASILWEKRVAAVGMPDWESAFDASGRIRSNVPLGLVGQTVIHEMMVAANAAAAVATLDAGVPAIYRNQGARPGGPGARFEATCHGHSSLGQPAYAQFFSALRRYTDLVNQRALCCMIDGTEPCHDLVDIARICARANVATQDAEAAGPRRKPRDPVTSALERMDPWEFRELLGTFGVFERDTLRETWRRLDTGLLSAGDTAWLALSPASPADPSFRQELVNRLASLPGMVAAAWEAAVAEGLAPPCDVECARSADGNWTASVRAGRLAALAQGSGPDGARDAATARLFCAAAGLQEDIGPCRGKAWFRQEGNAPRLAATCELAGWDNPQYHVEQNGEGDVLVSVTAITDTFRYVSPRVTASTPERAKEMVASLAHAALSPLASYVMSCEAEASGVDVATLLEEAATSPRLALEAFCTRHSASLHTSWIRERPSAGRYACETEIGFGDQYVRFAGSGHTRDAAADEAASGVISMIAGPMENLARPLASGG